MKNEKSRKLFASRKAIFIVFGVFLVFVVGTGVPDCPIRVPRTPTPEPVTKEMVVAAEKAILDSVQDKVDEIMAKLESGTSFDDLIKVGDRYLFSWAIYDVLDYRYGMRYAWSTNPMGPYVMPLDFDHDNILLQGAHDITGCGHACVTEYEGEYYITYGRHCKDRYSGWGRDMCCEKIIWLDDDHIVAIPSKLSR